MITPPPAKCAIAVLRISRLSLTASCSCGKGTGSMKRLISLTPLSSDRVRIRKSSRLRPTSAAMTMPSTIPDGWLATTISGPVAGILAT